MKINEIQELIKFVSKSGVSEVELETSDFKITIKAPGKGHNNKGIDAENTQFIQQVPMQMPMAYPQMPAAAPTQVAPQTTAPASAPATPASTQKPATASDDSKYVTVKSPMIGTFYRRPSPDKDNFVEVGQSIKKGDVVCVIEAMKLFNEIESEVNGTIVKFLLDDNAPVEYDQPLFLVDPA